MPDPVPSSTLAIEQLSRWAYQRGLLVEGSAIGDGAVFSADRSFRYLLWRAARPGAPFMAFAMLNPSQAGHRTDDPTVRRCDGYAAVCGQPLLIWNLFAAIATDPRDLARHPDPVGAHSDDLIDLVLGLADPTVAAWGAHGAFQGRATQVLRRAAARGAALSALTFTAEGQPAHPLRLPKALRPQPWDYSW